MCLTACYLAPHWKIVIRGKADHKSDILFLYKVISGDLWAYPTWMIKTSDFTKQETIQKCYNIYIKSKFGRQNKNLTAILYVMTTYVFLLMQTWERAVWMNSVAEQARHSVSPFSGSVTERRTVTVERTRSTVVGGNTFWVNQISHFGMQWVLSLTSTTTTSAVISVIIKQWLLHFFISC